MSFTTRLNIRFADIDWARAVYFARFFDYAHRTFEDFFNDHAKMPYATVLAERKLGFPIVANKGNYPNALNVAIPVDPSITAGQLLTGADFDIESVRRDRFGHLWFGEEFGPFLINTTAHGRVLSHEVPTC